MEPAKRPRGRPPIDNGESAWLGFRVSDARLAAYKAAAKRAGEALSAWAKRHLDRAAKK